MKLKTLFFLLFLSKFVAGQNQKDFLYVFDKDWKPVEVKKAIYLIHVQQVSDSCWQWDYYNLYGPMIKTEHYKDKDGEILHGEVNYYSNGKLDSGGTYINGKKDGDFWKFTDSFRVKYKYVYSNDSLIETIDVTKKDKQKAIEDSIKRAKQRELDSVEIESVYPGGDRGWGRYLKDNLKYPDRAVNGNFQGDVVIRFIIDKEGNLTNSQIIQSVEYSLDTEAMRIIKGSGKWVPAVQFGRKVKSYKQQPIAFRLR